MSSATVPAPGRVSERLHAETTLLLGWSAAILLQLSHPLVARGVADHSGFSDNARAPWERLHATVGAMLVLTFGGDDARRRTAAHINAIHDRVNGRLRETAGPYPAGTAYSAHDPRLLTWVHATCVDVFMRTYERFVDRLSGAERDRYCEEAAHVEALLGIPDGHLPRSARALADYMDAMYGSGDIVVTPAARELARALLHPPLPRAARPAAALARLVTVGLLPAPIRAAYGLSWHRRHRVVLVVAAWVIRRLLRVLPGALRDLRRVHDLLPATRSTILAPRSAEPDRSSPTRVGGRRGESHGD